MGGFHKNGVGDNYLAKQHIIKFFIFIDGAANEKCMFIKRVIYSDLRIRQCRVVA